MNTNHVIKMYMHQSGVKTACRIAENVMLLQLSPKHPFWGLCPPGIPSNAPPTDSVGNFIAWAPCTCTQTYEDIECGLLSWAPLT